MSGKAPPLRRWRVRYEFVDIGSVVVDARSADEASAIVDDIDGGDLPTHEGAGAYVITGVEPAPTDRLTWPDGPPVESDSPAPSPGATDLPPAPGSLGAASTSPGTPGDAGGGAGGASPRSKTRCTCPGLPGAYFRNDPVLGPDVYCGRCGGVVRI